MYTINNMCELYKQDNIHTDMIIKKKGGGYVQIKV